MTTLTLPPVADVAFFTQGNIASAPGVVLEDLPGGQLRIKNLKVFRTGNLTDSQGRQHLWTIEELDAAVENFTALNSDLPDVPVRVGHTRNAHDLAGWYEAVRRDGDFLFADVLITEPPIATKVKNGTFRSRSIEIGTYPSSQFGLAWPTVLGLAFVDLPAVTGLNYENPITGKQFHVVQEGAVMTVEDKLHTFTLNGVKTTDYAAVQAALDVKPPTPEPAKFSIGGTETTDYTVVQSYIADLEKLRDDTITKERTDFVAKLVADSKINAPQKADVEDLIKDMSAEQFAKYQKTWTGAPSTSLTQQFSTSGSNLPPTSGGDEDARNARIRVLKEMVQMHRDSKLDEETVSKFACTLELKQLTGTTDSK